VKESLSTLPCFNHVESISTITSGLSQQCFKVSADNQVYFAKTITNKIEVQVASCAAKQGFSPTVYYHDQHWLITSFINTNNLALTKIDHTIKISHGVKLMAQCHQLSTKPTELSPDKITHQLINKNHYSAQKKAELLHLIEPVLSSLNHNKNRVCCHGDLNFSNILIDQEQRTWLIDYECACSAPIEYDLAMFIAVNDIADNKISTIISLYEQQANSIKIDIKLLCNYLAFAYFINSLWYSHAHQNSNDLKCLNLHQQQWQKFITIIANK